MRRLVTKTVGHTGSFTKQSRSIQSRAVAKMKTNVVGMLFRNRSAARFAAALLWLGTVAITTPARASNPWGRAVGEAQCLHDVTEDLRNRAHRLFPAAPATALTCAIDESACQLLDLVKCGADWGQLQVALRRFGEIQAYLCRAITSDCHMSRDRTITNYLRMIDDRYGDLVRDLSKCKPPIPSCNTPYPSHYHPSLPLPFPQPYSGNDYGGYPDIQQSLQPQPYDNIPDPRYVNPNANPNGPQYWQGSTQRNSYYPRSTYDFDAATAGPSYRQPMNIGSTVPIDRVPSGNPVAAEILSLLLSRALR